MTKAKPIAGVLLLACVPSLCGGLGPVSPREAQEWAQHLLPLPHEISISQKYTLHPTGVAIKLREGAGVIEQQAAKELTELFRLKTGAAPGRMEFEIRLGVSAELAGGLRQHPNWQQAYIIRPAGTRKLLLAALDEKGIYYAVNTLQQLLETGLSPDAVSIPLAEITDWPDLEERGVWNFPQAYEPIASMPSEWVPWMASIKLNYGQMQTQIQNVKRDRPNHVAIQRDLYELAQRKALHYVPFLIHLNFLNDYGLFRAYPELAGKGDEALATRYFAHKSGDQRRVPYAGHPVFQRILAEWIADIGSQGANEVSVWLSERPSVGLQADTVAIGQSVMEARAVVGAWREAQRRYPNLGLRVFLSTTTSNRYYRVIAELPHEVKIERACAIPLERVLHLPRDLLRNPLLDMYAAEGRWIASYDVPLTANGRVETPEFMVPQSSAHRIRDYLRQIAARRYRAAYGMMAWSNKGKITCGFNINALAEWSWNLNGRTEKEFAIAWATREGLRNPELVGEWSELMGPIEFDVYDSDFPISYSWGLAAQMILERKRPHLGEGIFRYYATPQDFDLKISKCNEALRLAQGIDNTYLVHETRIVLSYVKLAKSLFQIAEQVATDDLSSLASQEKLRVFLEELNGSAKENAAAIREWRLALGPEPWHYRVHDAIQAPEKTARDVTEWISGRYFYR